ncbi:ABC transporter permease [Lapidilactobacillus achengensis]|uniref:ABC transporter permease n=1 Tax=Lapidilactobacillus achengensis TaxID=2486000 RepID=A0ABW1UNN5_9LACO|nr:ABC transporter permease [Lapidilactobacillus achengensis]
MIKVNSTTRKILIPLFSILAGFLVGAIIMLFYSYNPLQAYGSMIQGSLGSSVSIGETLRQATPLIFTALGFSVANSAGFFNIGLSGQALAGWVASIWVALAFPNLPTFVLLPLAIIAGALAGAIMGAIPGFLRAFFGTSEVIVTIMLNYVALYLSTYLMQDVMPAHFRTSQDATKMISHHATLHVDWLSHMFGDSRVHFGLFLALIALVVVWVIMKKTTLGFEIRSVGLNPFASEYAGMSSKKTIIMSMVISGTLAGLGGVMEGLGTYQNFFIQTASMSIGFDGMAVSLLGGGSSLGILLSALLFSILQIGGLGMQTGAGVPFEIVSIVTASIIFFVGIDYVISKLFKNKDNANKELPKTPIAKEVVTEEKDAQEGGRL